MMSKSVVTVLGAMCVLSLAAAPATATVVTSDKIDYVKTYALDPLKVSTVAGICFDPTYRDPVSLDYDRLFLLNRGKTPATQLLYWTSPVTESLSSGLVVTGGSGTTGDPTDIVVDSNGNAYIAFLTAASIEKVANPTTAPVQTRILGNYGASTADDDPISIDLLPANFGLAGYGAGDLLLFDDGLDSNLKDSLSAVKNDPPNMAHQVLWSKLETADRYYRGAASAVEGKYYFADAVPGGVTTVNIGGTVYPAILRMGGDMILETVALNLPAGETFTTLDDGVAVNPVDGSVWVVRYDELWGTRSVIRVDTVSAVDMGDNVFLANATVDIKWEGGEEFDCGINAMAWSPDGKHLAIGSLTTTTNGTVDDRLAIFVDDSIVTPPEIPGDADRDGKVEADDAQALATNWGTATGATWAMGDFNRDGAINAADASILAANWGATGEAVASVPEPLSATMLLAGVLAGLVLIRRTR